MITNGITIPDAGSTRQYIPDAIGGWMYVVTTTVAVEQHSLGDFQQQFDDAKAALIAAQKRVDELEPVALSFAQTVALAVPAPLDATSTPLTP